MEIQFYIFNISIYIMLLLPLFVFLGYSANINCSGANCASCLSGYSYLSTSCLNVCPYGYQSSSNTCVANSSQSLFYLAFYEFLDYSASSINTFSHPSGLMFKDQGKLSPIPSIDRGFYFVNTSQLVSNSGWVTGPDFTVRFYIRVTGAGNVFTVVWSGLTYYLISATNTSVTVTLNATTSSSSVLQSSSSSMTSSTWKYVLIYCSQSSGSYSIDNNGVSATHANYEFRQQFLNPIYYIGASVSGQTFRGFLYEFYADNSVIKDYNSQYGVLACDIGYYMTYTTAEVCVACDSSCPTWPWCTNSGTPYNSCYLSTCATCTGFAYSQCTSCTNSAYTAPNCQIGLNCLAGTGYSCTSCKSGFQLIDGLCITPPTLYNANALSTPIYDINFNTFSQYYGNFFYSGADRTTYAPSHSTSTDDPLPIKSRGFILPEVGYWIQLTISFLIIKIQHRPEYMLLALLW